MAAVVNAADLVERVTELATDHADLVLAVRKLLNGAVRTSAGSPCRVVHLCESEFDELLRLTGST